MGVAWWVSYRAIEAERVAALQQTQQHRRALVVSREVINELFDRSRGMVVSPQTIEQQPDWTVLDEPLVEP